MSAMGSVLRRLARFLPSDRLLLRGPASSGSPVALTFDDGPHPEHTLRILDILDAASACGTFFVQGDQAERHPDLVRAMHRRGHQVGNHAFRHVSVRRMGSVQHVADVQRTQRLLEDIVGVAVPQAFRPPFGDWSLPAFAMLSSRGYQFVLWSMDSDDSYVTAPDALVARVLAKRPSPGEILLFHEDYAHTVAALPTVLQGLSAAGLRFARICDMGPRGSDG